MTNYHKHLMLIGIKYGPVILSISCSFKIYILGLSDNINSSIIEITIHWANLILDLIFLGIIYYAGKALGYCWKHRSLCRSAFWGYIYYMFFLLFNVTPETTDFLSLYYLIANICLVIYYRF